MEGKGIDLCTMKESVRGCGLPSEEKCAGCGWSAAEKERRKGMKPALERNPATGLWHVIYEREETGTGNGD